VKLRLAPGAIRLRIQPEEIAALARTGSAHTTLSLGSGGRVLTYGVDLVEEGTPGIDWTGDRIRVHLPRTAATRWLAGKREGIRILLDTEAGPVELRVETDRHPEAGPRRDP
jgi:hypothetical protein